MNKIKHFSLMLLTLVMAMGLNACSDDDDNKEVAGINVVGTWYIIGDGDAFDKDNQVMHVYDIKADGTIIENTNVNCDCSHRYTNGTVDCSRDHFKEESRYKWEIKDGHFYLSGVGLAISKKSNDEFTVEHPFYEDETLTLKRIKKFTK